MDQTIFALSSGALPSGIAVIRLSGPNALTVGQKLTGKKPSHRMAVLSGIFDPKTGEKLDEALVLVFPSPKSFTGEDVVELHCHGGVATVAAVMQVLGQQDHCRPAEAGEFSRRAFENGRLDLTALEGLSDLIAAQTEAQRRLALSQSGGSLRELYDRWRKQLIRSRALIEAELDFSDEEDVPGSVSSQVWASVTELQAEILQHLDDGHRGELVRSGFRIALLGPPNSGKSSLLNALAKRDVAIVTPQAGTTRDVLEISLDIGGHLVIVSDTAGLRESSDMVEQEGIKRAKKAAQMADLTLWLQPLDQPQQKPEVDNALIVGTKNDLANDCKINDLLTTNTKNPAGLQPLLDHLKQFITENLIVGEESLVTRQRHRNALELTCASLGESLSNSKDIELRSEHLREAADSLGRITGRIDVEDLLDVIFSEFCIGK